MSFIILVLQLLTFAVTQKVAELQRELHLTKGQMGDLEHTLAISTEQKDRLQQLFDTSQETVTALSQQVELLNTKVSLISQVPNKLSNVY